VIFPKGTYASFSGTLEAQILSAITKPVVRIRLLAMPRVKFFLEPAAVIAYNDDDDYFDHRLDELLASTRINA